MATVLHSTHNISAQILQAALDCIHSDGVLAVGTESSYALAAGAQNQDAIQRVLEIKGHRLSKPLLLLVNSMAQVREVTSAIPPITEYLMNRFWPGPLTLILPAALGLSKLLTAGSNTIGVRQPNQPQLLQLLGATGPLTGTSANRSGRAPANTAEEIIEEFGGEIDLILDSGPSPGGKPSTILSLVEGIHLVRPGPISAETIQEALEPYGAKLHGALP